MARGQTAATVVAALCGLFGLMWFIMILIPSGWHRSTVFFVFRFSSGLYSVEVDQDMFALGLSAALSLHPALAKWKNALDKFTSGTFGLQEMRDRFCAVTNPYCDNWVKLQMGSWGMLFMGIMIVVFHSLAAGFMLYFWNSTQTETGRKCCRAFIISLPCLCFTSILLYFMLTVGFGDTDGIIPGSKMPIDYGPSFFVCCALTIFSIVPVIINESFVNTHMEFMAGAAREKRAILEFQQSGGTEMPGMAQPGYDQGYGYGPGGPPPGGPGYNQGPAPGQYSGGYAVNYPPPPPMPQALYNQGGPPQGFQQQGGYQY